MDPILLTVGALVGAVWCAVIFLRGGLLAGCTVVLLAGIVIGQPFFKIPMQPAPLTIDRLLMVFLVFQYLVWQRFGWTLRKPLNKADYLVMAFLLVLVVSTMTHDWQANNSRSLAYLLFFNVMPISLYWIARQVVLTKRGVYTLFACLAAFGLYLTFTAVCETCGLAAFVVPSYIRSSMFPEFLGRGRGPFLNPAANGMAMGLCLAAGCMWWQRLGRFGRFGIVCFSLAMLLGVYSTYTRSAWMGGVCSLLVTIAVQLPRGWRMRFVAGALVAGLLVVATQWESIVAFKRDEGLSARLTEESAELRPLLAQVAWNMFLDHPLFGVGFGHYLDYNTDYTNDRSSDAPLSKVQPYVQHNVWLGLLTETGLVGVAVFTMMIGYWLRNAWRLYVTDGAPLWARQQSLLFLAGFAAYFPNAMFQDMAITPMANMVLFFIAGLSEGIAYQARVAQPCQARCELASNTDVVGRPIGV